MVNKFQIADEWQRNIVELLKQHGILASVLSGEEFDRKVTQSRIDLILLDASRMSNRQMEICVDLCVRANLPTIALISRKTQGNRKILSMTDDFLMMPPDPVELITRASLVLDKTRSKNDGEIIRSSDLMINLSTYEVSLKGQRITLRFKEYALLRLLAANPGKVYTRESLLKTIWGFDYFGGTRTVDVHIRRLRAKIEDAEHSFIETIWNVGYRFKKLNV